MQHLLLMTKIFNASKHSYNKHIIRMTIPNVLTVIRVDTVNKAILK